MLAGATLPSLPSPGKVRQVPHLGGPPEMQVGVRGRCGGGGPTFPVAGVVVLGPLLQAGLQLGLLHVLWGVGRREQAGRVQGQALVQAQAGLAREAVLELQALEPLREKAGLARAQVAVRAARLRVGRVPRERPPVRLRPGRRGGRDGGLGLGDGGGGQRLAFVCCLGETQKRIAMLMKPKFKPQGKDL